MQTILKVYIEFATILFLFYGLVFLFVCFFGGGWGLQGMWDLSFLTRDQTCTPCFRRRSLNHWVTREVPQMWFLLIQDHHPVQLCFLPVLIPEGNAKDWLEFANKDVAFFWHLGSQTPVTSDSGSDLWTTVRRKRQQPESRFPGLCWEGHRPSHVRRPEPGQGHASKRAREVLSV